MICDKHRQEAALYFPLLLCSAFSLHSDLNHFTPMMERRSSYGKEYLTEGEISAELLVDTLSDVPDNAGSDSESDSDPSIIGNRQTKLCILYRVTVTVNKARTKVTMMMTH